jgi:hypothetical protein
MLAVVALVQLGIAEISNAYGWGAVTFYSAAALALFGVLATALPLIAPARPKASPDSKAADAAVAPRRDDEDRQAQQTEVSADNGTVNYGLAGGLLDPTAHVERARRKTVWHGSVSTLDERWAAGRSSVHA